MRSSSRERNAFVSIVTSGASTIPGWAGGEQGGPAKNRFSEWMRLVSSIICEVGHSERHGCGDSPLPVKKGRLTRRPVISETSVSPEAVDQKLSGARRAVDQGL